MIECFFWKNFRNDAVRLLAIAEIEIIDKGSFLRVYLSTEEELPTTTPAAFCWGVVGAFMFWE